MTEGFIAKKVGMSQKFDGQGKYIPVTLLYIEENVVMEKQENAVILGAVVKAEKKINKPQREVFKRKNLPFVSLLKKFFWNPEIAEIGQSIDLSIFKDIKYVDVVGITKGRGFSGVIKRHNFRSLCSSHGVSISERGHGSTGQRQDPGRVFKNKKMAGHYGQERCTIQNLTVVDFMPEEKLILVKGAVPGCKNSIVFVHKAKKVS